MNILCMSVVECHT